MRRLLARAVWGVSGFGVAIITAEAWPGRLALILAGAYAIGWILLERRLSTDPECAALRRLLETGPGVGAAALAVLFLQAVGLAISARAMVSAAVLLGLGVLALWSVARSPESLVRCAGNLLLLGVSLGLSVGIGEIVFRLPPIAARTGGCVRSKDAWLMKADRIWHENIFRLRSLHVEGPRPAGTLRIAALGDSFTWGDKIPRTEDLWPSVLERSLSERGRPTHVINLAQNGYTTVNEAETLRRIGWRFDPHIVLLQFTLNDPLPSRPGFWSERERWLFPTWPLIPPFDEKLRANSYLYAWLNDSFVSLQMAWRHSDGYAPLFDDGFHGWRDCRLALQEMADETRRRGVPMLMVLFPIFHQGDLDEQSYPNLDLHRKVEAAAREAGLPCLDLRPVFAREDPHSLRWRAFPWDGHPGVDAHRLAGRAVAAELERLALIPSPREPE